MDRRTGSGEEDRNSVCDKVLRSEPRLEENSSPQVFWTVDIAPTDDKLWDAHGCWPRVQARKTRNQRLLASCSIIRPELSYG